MNIKPILLASAAVFTLSVAAYAADQETYQTNTKIEKDSDGNYSKKDTTTKTDAAGTTSYEEKATVAVDANGDTDKSTTTKAVTDPKGIFNKSTVTTTSNTEKVKDGTVKTSQEVKVDGKTVESNTATTTQ